MAYGGQAKETGAGKQEGSLTNREAPAQELKGGTKTQANYRGPIKACGNSGIVKPLSEVGILT